MTIHLGKLEINKTACGRPLTKVHYRFLLEGVNCKSCLKSKHK